jgi:hypothetical protein
MFNLISSFHNKILMLILYYWSRFTNFISSTSAYNIILTNIIIKEKINNKKN